MVVVCWSVKGGAGVTTVAAALALAWRGGSGGTPLLVDLGGDLPACLGADPPTGPGVGEWAAAGAEAPADALGRLVVPVGAGLDLLARGRGEVDADRAGLLVQLLAAWRRPVVVDAGPPGEAAGQRMAAEADRSLLVTRACYLGLTRCRNLPLRPSGVVVVRDPGRAIASAEVAAVVGAPLVAEVAVDPAVARAVDAGLACVRLPRRHLQVLRAVAR